jgi:hypothetical protein
MSLIVMVPMPDCSRFVVLAALAMLVAGCSDAYRSVTGVFKKKQEFVCPRGAIVKDASRLTTFRPGPGRDITDIKFEARLPRLLIGCKYDDKGVEVQTSVTIIGARGPADTTHRAQVRYFVAVLNPRNQVIGKKEFSTQLEFPINIDRGAVSEELVERIPVGRDVSASGYTVVVGFQLTRAELQYNRTKNVTALLGPPGVRPRLPGDKGGPARETDHEPGFRPGILNANPDNY